MALEHVGLQQLTRGPRGDDARQALADALPEGSDVGTPDEEGIFEAVVEADDFDAALTTVFDAVAAAGADDHLVFIEHPDLPDHIRTA